MRAQDGISLTRAAEHLAAFLALPIEFLNPAGLHYQALVLADALGLPATYDAHYLALAEHFGCELWTDDQRLLRHVAESLPFVRWIGDHPAAAGG
jgi:predicted nucleic acid-binding protein